MRKIYVNVIGAKAELEKKSVTVQLTHDELLMALKHAGYCHNYYAEQVAKPTWSLRRAYKKGKTTEEETKHEYETAAGLEKKLAGALLGVNVDKLQEAVKKLNKG